jgi:hypothetical protein
MNEVDAIVARFPGPVSLVPSSIKWWIMMGLSGVMTAACVFGIAGMLPDFYAGKPAVGLGLE